MAKTPALEKIGKWSLGYDRSTGGSILLFEFSDREPIFLLVPSDEAKEMAQSILDQHKNPPTGPHQ